VAAQDRKMTAEAFVMDLGAGSAIDVEPKMVTTQSGPITRLPQKKVTAGVLRRLWGQILSRSLSFAIAQVSNLAQ
jgi:hypothetical protein